MRVREYPKEKQSRLKRIKGEERTRNGGWMEDDDDDDDDNESDSEKATASTYIFSVRRQSHVGGLLRTIKMRTIEKSEAFMVDFIELNTLVATLLLSVARILVWILFFFSFVCFLTSSSSSS